MAENKFIKHLKGEQAIGSLVEIKNQNTPASFGNMPQGSSNANVKYADVRGDVTVVANGTTAWKLNDSALTLAPIVNGDGTDYTGKYEVSGAGLWVNSTYTFPSTGDPNHPVAMIFNPNSKWVLKLCGDNLIVNDGNTLELTVVITIGSSNIISKQFTIIEQANQFCKELVIDFDESNSSMIKASGLATLQLQVLCGTAGASARIYNGMTTLTVLQRKVDAAVVSSAFANVEEVLRDGVLPSDYFNNAAYIAQIEDGEDAYAVFTRDGDDVNLSGWTPKEEIAKKEEIIIKSATIPTASADLVGKEYQYFGETNGTYTHGFVYECSVIITPSSITASQTTGTSLSDIAVDIDTFEAYVEPTTDTTLVFAYDNAQSEWIDAEENIVQLSDYGISYTGTPENDDVITIAYTAEAISYDWERVNLQPVIDNLTSTSTTAALSANQGKVLNDRIDDVSGRGRFLALWNCATGLAETNPPESPYTYKAGDYFVVGTISTATPAVNYKPNGSSYTTGVASTTVETNEVSINDTYFYDGTTWKLQSNAQKEVSFSALAGSPYDNTNLATALNSKANTSDLQIIQVDTMPVASATNLGQIVQWIGADGTYTNGFFYKNVATTTASGTIAQTFGASLSDITLDVETFQEQIDEAGTYIFTFDGSDWYYGDDTVDLGDYGISFSGDPVEDDELTVVITETTTYGWVEKLVQHGVTITYNAETEELTIS